MRVRIIGGDRPVAIDGVLIKVFKEGEIVEFPEHQAAPLIRDRWAENAEILPQPIVAPSGQPATPQNPGPNPEDAKIQKEKDETQARLKELQRVMDRPVETALKEDPNDPNGAQKGPTATGVKLKRGA